VLAFLAMEFPDGELMSSRLADGEWLDEHATLSMAVQLAQAMHLVHRHGVVHGELGADSVLLTRGDRVLWWDVPLVLVDQMTDRRGESRSARQLVKTAAYLAPECARGEPATEASDVYSLAALLCIASGAPPPGAVSTLGIVHAVAGRAWAPKVTPVFPERWAAVVRQMLQHDPGQRPSAKEVSTLFSSFASVATPATKLGLPGTKPSNDGLRPPDSPGAPSLPEAVNGDSGALEAFATSEKSSGGLRFAVIGAALGVVAALALVLAFIVRAPSPSPAALPNPAPTVGGQPSKAPVEPGR